jgi:phage terminase large subunit
MTVQLDDNRLPVGFNWRQPDYTQVYVERTERLTALRAPGFDLAALKAYYKDNPADFVHDWGFTVDPRNAELGKDVVVPFVLFPRQRQYLTWLYERWKRREDGLVEKSRDMGLSWLCIGFGVWMWIFHPSTVVGFGSRKEEYVDKIGDTKSLFWKARQFIKLLPVEFIPKGYSEQKHAPSMLITNPENGASIVGEAGANIGRGNRTSIYFKDESAFYEQADSIDAALSQTSNCKIDVSTPNGVGNPFHRKRTGGRIKVFVFDWRDDPRKGDDWYREQVEKIDDPVIVAQEIDRDYSASVSNAYIGAANVAVCQALGPADVPAVGPLLVGVDVARFGNDKCCITFRRGRVVISQILFGKVDVVDCAGRVKDEVLAMNEKPGQIAVDTIGIGAGVADILRREKAFWLNQDDPQSSVVQDVNSSLQLDDGQNFNLRARMWRDMRDYIKAVCSLPNDPDLTTDLTALRYMYRQSKLLIESKEDAKKRGLKSPDRADSLALTFAYPPKEIEPQHAHNPVWDVLDEVVGY